MEEYVNAQRKPGAFEFRRSSTSCDSKDSERRSTSEFLGSSTSYEKLDESSIKGSVSFSEAATDEFFLIVSTGCESLKLRERLLQGAVRKDGKRMNADPSNLLFPPSLVNKILGQENREAVNMMLDCECFMCQELAKKTDQMPSHTLLGAITNEHGKAQRILVARLIFMGAGFAIRQMIAYMTEGYNLRTLRAMGYQLKTDLFEPFKDVSNQKVNGILISFRDPSIVTSQFSEIFDATWPIFNSPAFLPRSPRETLSGFHLPFIEETQIETESQLGRLLKFKIHEEFRNSQVPVSNSQPTSLI
jgi:hypothetical protein